jgi:anionic cell wall polymer biosynthesis LytR-Cps2A-Psr (LCP) family protein
VEEVPKGKHRADIMALFFLVGACLVAFLALIGVTEFVERVHTTISGVSRTDTLGAYPGRPSAVQGKTANALNYLVLVSDSDQELYAAIVLHLSADRNKLTLVALPPDIRSGASQTSLAESFNNDAVLTWRDVELLTDTRMDHQMTVWIDKLDPVIRAMGGIALSDDEELMEASKLSGRIFSSLNKTERAMRVSEVMRALIGKFSVLDAISNPGQFDEVMRQLTHCVEVDQGLSSAEIESVIMGLKVNPDEIKTYFIPETTTDASLMPNTEPVDPAPATSAPSILGADDPITVGSGSAGISGAGSDDKRYIQQDPTLTQTEPVTLVELRDSFHSDDFSALP